MAIDYTKENFEDLPEKFDVVYDAIGKILHYFYHFCSSNLQNKILNNLAKKFATSMSLVLSGDEVIIVTKTHAQSVRVRVRTLILTSNLAILIFVS